MLKRRSTGAEEGKEVLYFKNVEQTLTVAGKSLQYFWSVITKIKSLNFVRDLHVSQPVCH